MIQKTISPIVPGYWITCPSCGQRYWSEDPHICADKYDEDDLEEECEED